MIPLAAVVWTRVKRKNMKDKIFEWIGRNRQTIGYTASVCGALAGLSHALQGNFGLALLWLVIGGMIFIDTRRL